MFIEQDKWNTGKLEKKFVRVTSTCGWSETSFRVIQPIEYYVCIGMK